MPKFNVMINRTRSIETSAEIEVAAKDEETAGEKARQQIAKAQEKANLDDAFEWDTTADDDEFEYDISQAEGK